jgi:hypothetical protein
MIVVAGDSWGCGEWSPTSFTVTHGGLAEYLTRTHKVVNLSRPGGSNWQSYERLKNFFTSGCAEHSAEKTTHIFVFQTEWWRDFKLLTPFPRNNHSLYDFSELASKDFIQIIYNWYYRLSELAQENQVKIGIIGGMSDTEYFNNFSNEIPGVFVACQSMVNLCINDNHLVTTPCYGIVFYDIVEQLKKYINLDQLNCFIDQSLERDEILCEYKKWFWPDAHHGNRLAHHKLYNIVKTLV